MKKIDVKRFNAFITFTRSPQGKNILKEIEWYENYNSNVFATIILDMVNMDFSVVILRRDKDSKFRCSDTKYSLASIEEARKWMLDIVEKIDKSKEYIFVQHDEKGKNIDIFNTIKNKNISNSFKILNNSDEYKPAKLLISEIMPHYIDIDGNFVEQFQTTGFDARIWELYLYCYFNEEKFIINKDYNAPDFYISKEGYDISIEAATLSNKDECQLDGKIDDRINNILPIRFGSSIKSKIDHVDKNNLHYWEYEHTKGKPFIIAIADFSNDISMTYSSNSLINYLYGYSHETSHDENGNLNIIPKKIENFKYNNKIIDAGFFLKKENENISAILSSTSGTLNKFLRIGKQSGFDKYNKLCIMKEALYYDPNPNASIPIYKISEVTEKSNEKWSDGLSIYHNPNAKFQIQRHLFPNATHHFFKDGLIETITHPYSLLSSITHISIR